MANNGRNISYLIARNGSKTTMKIIFVLLITALLASCVSQPSMNELIIEAMRCVREYSENGIVKPAPKEYQTECWAKVTRRSKAEDRREAKRKADNFCRDMGMIKYCNSFGCGCITREEMYRVLGRW